MKKKNYCKLVLICIVLLLALSLNYNCLAQNELDNDTDDDTVANPVLIEDNKLPSFLQSPDSLVTWRCGVYGAMILSATYYSFSNMDDVWGPSSGKFHIKENDWNNDPLAYTDEISHMLVSYKLTQACKGLFSWCGFSQKKSRILGALGATLWMTAVEYPIDAYNPKQGLGYSDLVFNTLGISLATLRDAYPWAHRFDLKLSLESTKYFAETVVAMNLEENNNYIYWLTYQPNREKLPFNIGFGYSGRLKEDGSRAAEPQGYLGIGISLSDLTPLVGRDWGTFLGNFGFYNLSIYVEIF